MGKTSKILIAAAIAAAGTLAVAAPASAYVDGGYAASGVRLRQTPYTSDNRINGLGYPGQTARLWCYTTGTDVDGGWPYWDSNTDLATGKWGYSYEHLLTGNYLSLGHC